MTWHKPTAKKITAKKRIKLYYRISSGPSLRLHLPPDRRWVRRHLNQHSPGGSLVHPAGKSVRCWRSFSAGGIAPPGAPCCCSGHCHAPPTTPQPPCTQPAPSKILLLAPRLKPWRFSAAGSAIRWARPPTEHGDPLRAEPCPLPRRDGESWSRWESPPA